MAGFFHDGEHLLAYHIPLILRKLSALASIIYRLEGFRFYGCSLLFIYDGARSIQRDYEREYKRTVVERDTTAANADTSDRLGRGRAKSEEREGARRTLRRTHSEDVLPHPLVERVVGRDGKRKRGEVIIRIVDFAHTTTGNDYLVYPPDHPLAETELVDGTREVLKSGKGYLAEIDPDSGLPYARFPPKHPEQADFGFLFGLKNLYESLENIYDEERNRRAKRVAREASISSGSSSHLSNIPSPLPSSFHATHAVSSTELLPPLSTEPKEIFTTIFADLEDGGISS